MRRLNSRILWLIGLAAFLIVVWLFPLPAISAPNHPTLQIDARQFEFTPGRLEVNQGDIVTINLTASDAVHGFYLDGYGIQQSITPGISQQITFTTDQPGMFRYRCSVSCGTLHPFMIGELMVNANAPMWRAVATLAVSLGGILFYLWHFGGNEA